MGQSQPEEPRMYREIKVKACPELFELIAKEADRLTKKLNRGISLGEVLLLLAAERFKRPQLGFVPRKPLGRPRKTA